MDWLVISGLILFGTFLIVAEVIFVPGTTVVGILGVIFSVYGIYLGYDYFGSTTGTYILIGTLLINLIALVLAFRGKSWQKLSLKETLTGRVNDDYKISLEIGNKGKTISAIKPIGKAIFDDQEIEVRSKGEYIEEDIEVEIVLIDSNRIFIKPIK